MKSRETTPRLLILLVVGLIGVSGVLGQSKRPPELNPRATLPETLSWIGKAVTQARVGLDNNAPDPQPGEVVTDVTPYSEWVEFSSGFNIGTINGCKIELTNDKAQLIRFSSKYPDPKKASFSIRQGSESDQPAYPASFTIRLDNLSQKGGKRPYEYEKKGVPVGSWRVEYRLRAISYVPFPTHVPTKGEMKQAILNPPLKATLKGSGENGRDEFMTGDTLSFLFADKGKAEEFDAAFRLAISRCQ